MLLALCALASVLSPQTTSAEVAATPGERVDRLFSRWDRLDSPGCAVSVVQNGEILLERCYGAADLEHHVPISPTTVFELCSMTKQFTAMAAVLLEQEGKLSFDDDVRKHVPELPDYGERISLRHLLHHTSGLREQWFLWELAGWRWQDVITKADMLDLIARQVELNHPPGAEHSYTNTGYFLLGLVIERVSGRSLGDFARERIFAPLGMCATRFREDHTELIPDRALSYHDSARGGFTLSLSNVQAVGDGGLQTTLRDLERWHRNFFDREVGGDAGIGAMLQTGRTVDGKEFEYGLGLRIGTWRGLEAIWHGGAAYGWRTEAIRFPEEDLTVTCLANLSSIDAGHLTRRVAQVYLADRMKEDSPPAVRPGKPPLSERKLEDVADAAGLYWAGSTQSLWKLSASEGKLSAELDPGDVVELRRHSGNRFVAGENPMRGVVDFEADGAGPWRLRALLDSSETRIFERVDPVRTGADAAAEYGGRYSSDEVRETYALSASGADLVLHRDRFQDTRLTPLFGDAFRNDWLGVVRFERDANGAIRALAISNPVRGVRRLVFRRVP